MAIEPSLSISFAAYDDKTRDAAVRSLIYPLIRRIETGWPSYTKNFQQMVLFGYRFLARRFSCINV